jgi:hypothetical protein
MVFKRYDWPITVKVPLLVMALMLGISFVISNTVLSRLADTQERHLRTLSRAYIDGLSANLMPHMLREDVWEVFDTLDRARSVYAGLNALNTIVLNSSDRIIAASDPKSFPTAQPISPDILKSLDRDGTLLIDEGKRTARLLKAVSAQGQHIGGIYTELDISALLCRAADGAVATHSDECGAHGLSNGCRLLGGPAHGSAGAHARRLSGAGQRRAHGSHAGLAACLGDRRVPPAVPPL